MPLTISGELAQKLIGLLKKDKALARSIAADWVRRIGAASLANYLITADVAREVLAARLLDDPGGTLEALAALEQRGDRPQRTRLTARQLAGLKKRIVAFLGAVERASRKEIIRAARVPTTAIYNRVMGELRDEGLVASEGTKARAVYFLPKKARRGGKSASRR